MKVYDPTRAEYNKRDRDGSCAFCRTEVINDQNCTKFNFDHWYVLVNKHPYMDGNVMLVTKQHHESLETLSDDEWNEFKIALLEVQKVLKDLLKVDAFNIGINSGEGSGQSVAHVHWQVIPRRKRSYSVVNQLADIQILTILPSDLRKKLSN